MRALLGISVILLGCACISSSCKKVIPIAKSECRLPESVLPSDTALCILEFQIDSLAPIMYVKLEVEIHYTTQVGRDDLSLTFYLNQTEGGAFSQTIPGRIPVRIDNKWQGYTLSPNKEYLVTGTVMSPLKIFPGKYVLQVKGANEDLPFMPGILGVTARLYRV